MAEYVTNNVQTVLQNQNVLFMRTLVNGNSSIFHRDGSGLITLRSATCQYRARFKITFSTNMAVPTEETPGPISLAVAINGESIPYTNVIVTPRVTDAFFNASRSIYLDIPTGTSAQISIKNTSSIPINVENINIIVERVA